MSYSPFRMVSLYFCRVPWLATTLTTKPTPQTSKLYG